MIKAYLPISSPLAHIELAFILGEVWTMVDPTGRMQARQHRRRVSRMQRDGIEITVIDDRDIVGFAASATRIEELYMTNVENMADRVLRKVNSMPFKVRRLNILDHGNKDGMEIGDDWITIETLPNYARHFRRLRGIFHRKGFVHFQHCDVGSNLPLLVALSDLVGVPVYAGTGAHNPVYRFNKGQYNRCVPDGRCEEDVD
ncbi:MAG: hypothetical protein AAFY56_12715, partial [Pseudomonadota bacterium]